MPDFGHPLILNSAKPQADGIELICFGRNHVYSAAGAVEFYFAVDQGEQGEIFSLTDAEAGVEFVADLPNDDIAGNYVFAGKAFNAAALTGGIATIAAGTLTFFMCH